MRVVAGTARGRRLVAPPGSRVRPTSDRVREAIFNALGSLDAVDGARVVDLFAGTGALGIEALSRGAAHVTFVDADRRAIDAVRENLAVTDVGGEAVVLAADAIEHLRRLGPGARYDLAFCDPPYDFAGWGQLLAALPCDLVVVESGEEVPAPPGWLVERHRRYGSTVVAFLRPAATDPVPTELRPNAKE
ncbi:MAG: 16S rRNA (guanine(966)-N(2))-methyltransferase RsmD [Acidimicrobiia bacterium]|nr:16S rRNA (guanine(966)-N(2))-methyltransferase RsmD [Acidimicrobiia bacterium]